MTQSRYTASMKSSPNFTSINPLSYIDSHCHLDFARLGQPNQLISDAKAVGVNALIVPSVDQYNWSKVLKLGQKHCEIYPALGIHPYFVQAQNSLEQLVNLATIERNQIVAIGEIGLDGAIDMPLHQQLEVLVPQLKLASDLELPVICHAHKAYDPLLKQLRLFQLSRGGVVHGFSGSTVQANEFIKLGFKLGIGGVITYPRANKIRRLVSQLDLANIVLETDAPDMPLNGQQGQTNTPINIPIIAQTVSELTGADLSCVAACTTANCREMFLLQM